MLHLDTNVVLRLALKQTSRLSERVRRLMRRELLTISPMVLLELEHLSEIGRFAANPVAVIAYLEDELAVEISSTPFVEIIARARTFAWTRDAFDRVIVANAMVDDARLVTSDNLILENFPGAVW